MFERKYVILFLALSSYLMTMLNDVEAGCPVTDNPSQMFQCLTINPQAFIDLISKGDYKSFCHMANGYMTCMTTYVRDCLGGKAATGILEELQDLNLKCCISGRSQDCIIKNPSLLQKCFPLDAKLTLDNGEQISIKDAKVGAKVKSIDSRGHLIDTEIISILHKDLNKTSMFKTFWSDEENFVSMTNSHLVFVKEANNFMLASQVNVGDNLKVYSSKLNGLVDFKVNWITFEMKDGFIAPLTSEGTLLVNNVLSSCYAEINSHLVADLAMQPIKLWHTIKKYAEFYHLTSANINQNNDDASNLDLSDYIKVLLGLATKFLPSLFF